MCVAVETKMSSKLDIRAKHGTWLARNHTSIKTLARLCSVIDQKLDAGLLFLPMIKIVES